MILLKAIPLILLVLVVAIVIATVYGASRWHMAYMLSHPKCCFDLVDWL